MAPLHTSAVLQAVSARTRKAQRTLKANIQRRKELEQQAQQNRPHVVLGHKSGDEAKWLNCDLARVLVSEAEVRAPPPPKADMDAGLLQPPKYFNYGLGEKERKTLFDVLPKMTAEGMVNVQSLGQPGWTTGEVIEAGVVAHKGELFKSEILARLVDLRNANARGIAYENRRRIVALFSESENPVDTGRPEVQGACFLHCPIMCLPNSCLQLRLRPCGFATYGSTWASARRILRTAGVCAGLCTKEPRSSGI